MDFKIARLVCFVEDVFNHLEHVLTISNKCRHVDTNSFGGKNEYQFRKTLVFRMIEPSWSLESLKRKGEKLNYRSTSFFSSSPFNVRLKYN